MRLTLPLGGERAGRNVQWRVAVLIGMGSEPAAVAPTSRHLGRSVTWALSLPGDGPSRRESLYGQDGFSAGWADLFCVSLTQATPTDLVKQPLVAPLEALPLASRRVRSPHDAVLVRDEEELVVAQLSVVKVIEEALAPLDRNA